MTEVLWSIPIVVTALAWIFSLRRTPWPGLWFILCAMSAAVSTVIISAGMMIHHKSILSWVGIEFAACVLPLIVVLSNEGNAVCDDGPRKVKKWRQRQAKLKKAHDAKWVVTVTATSENSTVLCITRDGKSRHIGIADPLEDLEAFEELRIKAEDAANTYNTLHVNE